jgi:hypothetical protein
LRCCDIRLPSKKTKATKFRDIFFLGRQRRFVLFA